MLISELPTARLRARAYELSENFNKELDEAFCFSDTEEGDRFWGSVYEQDWLNAMALQPRLFELDASKVDESNAMLEGICNDL